MPVINKVKGKETVNSILTKIESSVSERLNSHFKKSGFETYPEKIVLLAFKEEKVLQVYGMHDDEYKFVKEYPFTASSGVLGPKLKEGDKQIPEGIYKVEFLNPNSSYYLSIKVDFPNAFDKQKTAFDNIEQMGGDIFIHGKSATIGCIPVGDEAIEEIFVMCNKAMHHTIPVIISPRDFRVNKIYPDIKSVTWEQELYDMLMLELEKYSKQLVQ